MNRQKTGTLKISYFHLLKLVLNTEETSVTMVETALVLKGQWTKDSISTG